MYPTKSYDCEEHRVEHAMRHARVLNAVGSHSDISGSFGWCMADYNTHQDFGSGDRVCYHGVLDMFRNPKLAAAVYASQGSRPMLEISSSMDIGEHPACIKGDIWAFTNADSLKVYKNGEFISEYSTKNASFPHLDHSPILIDDFIGDSVFRKENFKPGQAKLVTEILNHVARHGYGKIPLNILLKAARCMVFYGMKYNDIVGLYTKHSGDWGGKATVYRFDAIKDGEVVKTVTKKPMTKARLKVEVYKTQLVESESYDVTALRIYAVDENGNILHFAASPVKISVEGPISLIGPDMVSLSGGMSGTYVKSVGRSGEATVKISSSSYGEATVNLTVRS